MVNSLFTHIVHSEEKKMHMCRKMHNIDRRKKNIVRRKKKENTQKITAIDTL